MKPTREQGIQVQSTIEGDVATMSIDTSAMQHIMAILTDLYSDPELAVLREYSTNALDAHIEAGNPMPIEVTTPSALTPYFTVKDYGIGLSVDDIHRIYSQYGASTKRGTNEQVGMLGLGCKSALTYTQQFTVTSRKDGEKIAVAVSRDDDGGGSMTVVSRTDTDEANGVEVTIPARRGNEFDAKCKEFFSYWPEGTVLLNGQPPKRIDGLWITDSLCVTKDVTAYSYNKQESKVVMGNVAYPVEFEDDWLPYQLGLIAYVPIGSVNFTPSREALHYTNHTKATIKNLRASYEAAVPGAIQREVDKAESHADALRIVADWSQYLTNRFTVDFKFKGDKLPSEFTVTELKLDPDGSGNMIAKDVPYAIKGTPANDRYGRLSGSSTLRSVPASTWPSCVWVYNYTPAGVDANQKRKMMKWVEDNLDNGPTINQFILLSRDTNPSDTNKFIPASQCVQWDTVRAIKLESIVDVNRPWKPPHIPGSYDVYVVDRDVKDTHNIDTKFESSKVKGDEIDQSLPIIYIHGNKWAGKRHARDLVVHYPKFTLVCLPQNRIEKFVRDVPKTLSAKEAIDKKLKAWLANLTDDVKLSMFLARNYDRNKYQALDEKRIDDPELQKLIRSAKVATKQAEAMARTFGFVVDQPEGYVDILATEYPLAEGAHRLGSAKQDHVYVYINAVYAAEGK